MSVAKKPAPKQPKKTPVAKKVAKKPAAKKSVTTAKTLKATKNTKTETAKKKVVKITTANKKPKSSVARKKPVSAATKKQQSPNTKQTATKRKHRPTAKQSEQAVHVPTNAPLRSVEKAEVLRTELSLVWQQSMHTIAIVSSFCFLLVGATYASAGLFNTTAPVQNSALVSSAATEEQTSKFTLQSKVPEILTEETKILFTLSKVDPASVKYYYKHQDTQLTSQRQDVVMHMDDKYSFRIDPADMPSGKYQLYVQYIPRTLTNTQSIRKIQTIASFNVPVQQQTDTNTPDTSQATSNGDPETATNTQEEPVEDKSTVDTKDDALASEEQLETATPTETPEDDVTDLDATQTQDSDFVIQDTQTVDQAVATSTTVSASATPARSLTDPVSFSLYSQDTIISGLLLISSVQSEGYRNLALYARPLASLNARFLTQASERDNKKVFVVNTESFLPNGKYEVYAQGTDSAGKIQTTPSLVLTVKNESDISTVPVSSLQPVKQETVQTDENDVVATEQLVQPERSFAPVSLDEPGTDVSIKSEIVHASERLLSRESESIKKLLQNYASAKQSNDEILIRTARESLSEKRVKLANQALIDKELAGIEDDVIANLTVKLADLQNKVDTFEQIRNQKSGGASAVDTDSDGISDFDEIYLYRTNPNLPDTDGDGFADGIEIMRGFNPLDDTAEAVVEFESPKQSVGLVQADTLTVEEVTPVVSVDGVSTRAEIRGRGLPNSFVTLYIFSTPTIVTIKTDADGSFVYTLDTELEDGTHDVYVALTDNTGAIVAQSNPFTFIKEAQAFTPVDAAGAIVNNTETVVQSTATNSYNTVIALAVLSLGLILMMLGLSLRIRDSEVIAEADTGTDKISARDKGNNLERTT
jgi:hypothetical protein